MGLIKGFGLSIILFGAAISVSADEVSITTFYPSPNAVYKSLETSGETVLATGGDAPVGIGTRSPVADLDIRHASDESGEQTVMNLSASDSRKIRINLFTKGTPSLKTIQGNAKGWQVNTIGNDFEDPGTAEIADVEANQLRFDYHDGDRDLPESNRWVETMSLSPGKVAVAQTHADFDLHVRGTVAVGDSAAETGSAEFFTEVQPDGSTYKAITVFRSASVPESGEARHAFYFQTVDNSTPSVVRKTVPDVFVDGSVFVADDVVLTATGHPLSQTGFVTGTYVGTGSVQTIQLGFQPRYIQIWGAVQTTSGSSDSYVTSTFEKSQDMPNGWAVYSFSENTHTGNPPNSTRNENTFGRTFTYYFPVGVTILSDGFRVVGTNSVVAGYFEPSGLDPSGNGIHYFYLARR